MNNHISVPEALTLLQRYRQLAEEFATREEKLDGTYRSATLAAKRAFDGKAHELREQLDSAVRHSEAAHANAQQKARDDHQARQNRLARAHQHAERALRERVDRQRGARVGGVQYAGIQRQRQQGHILAEAEQTAAEITANLKKGRKTLSSLSGAGTFALFGYLLRWMKVAGLIGGRAPIDASSVDASALNERFTSALGNAETALKAINGNALTWILRLLPPWLLTVLGIALWFGTGQTLPPSSTVSIFAGVTAFLWVLQFIAGSRIGPQADTLAESLAEVRSLIPVTAKAATEHVARLRNEFQEADEKTKEASSEEWKRASAEAEKSMAAGEARLSRRWHSAQARAARLHERALRFVDSAYPPQLQGIQAEGEAALAANQAARETDTATRDAKYHADWAALAAEWRQSTDAVWTALEKVRAEAADWFPEWSPDVLAKAGARSGFAVAAPFGTLAVDMGKLATRLPKDPRLSLPGPPTFDLPLTLLFPQHGSLLFESGQLGREASLAALNDVVFRLLATVPPAQLSFTLIDPVGLGSSFSSLAHLADYEGGLVTNRIWTQKQQIEQRLTDLNEHLEKVIQMYLRNTYATIAEYNEQAGNIAERYHFVVIADFPANFSEQALRQLQNLVTSGPRCGVFTLLHWDSRLPFNDNALPDELRAASVRVVEKKGGQLALQAGPENGVALRLDRPPVGDAATDFLHRIGQLGRDAARVEVPFNHVTPAPGEEWKENTAAEVRVPIGRTGASKLQYLELGKGTRQHALFAGKTGSGKSNLFHVIIANLALYCSPDEVEFYLVDFKKGVEFKCYATHRLPHARVVAIESDREFGLSVLQRVDEELRRRGDLFRRIGVQDMAGYRRESGKPLPRSLLVIDEFQEFFTEDDRIAQTASVLLDRIVRQGRAFGIHVLLGSQTLGGAYSLARATLGQMVVRVALQCNEADALLIMDDGNSAARLLSRPGEGIYNDSAGALEGNSPFQAVFVPENVRDEALEHIAALSKAHPTPEATPPVVFEGNAPADISDNSLLVAALSSEPTTPPVEPRFWLGAPNSIKGPTEAVFRRQSGNHLLIVGQRDEAAFTMLGLGMVALAAQHPAGAVRLILCDATAPGTTERAFFDSVIAALPRRAELARGEDILTIMGELSGELTRRMQANAADDPPIFIFLHGIQRSRKLRYDEDLAYGGDDAANHPSMQFDRLVKEGASHGIHIVATVDTYNNLMRFVSRKALSEFEMRILFQMSANDSSSLIDTPVAGTLGLNRALFHHEHEGYQEIFRPYGPPTGLWLEEVADALARRPAPAPRAAAAAPSPASTGLE